MHRSAAYVSLKPERIRSTVCPTPTTTLFVHGQGNWFANPLHAIRHDGTNQGLPCPQLSGCVPAPQPSVSRDGEREQGSALTIRAILCLPGCADSSLIKGVDLMFGFGPGHCCVTLIEATYFPRVILESARQRSFTFPPYLTQTARDWRDSEEIQ